MSENVKIPSSSEKPSKKAENPVNLDKKDKAALMAKAEDKVKTYLKPFFARYV